MVSCGRSESKLPIAEESLKTRRAREKLKKKFDILDKKVTEEALEKKSIEIQRWIERHAPHRIALKGKSISLFDENQNTAMMSHRIRLLSDQIGIFDTAQKKST